MNGHRRQQAFQMELREESIALRRPAHKSAGGKQINWVPKAVVPEQSEDGRRNVMATPPARPPFTPTQTL